MKQIIIDAVSYFLNHVEILNGNLNDETFGIRRDNPDILANNNQVVLSTRNGYVAKFKMGLRGEGYRKEIVGIEGISPDFHIFYNHNYNYFGLNTLVMDVINSPKILKEFGLNPLPHYYFGLEINDSKIYFKYPGLTFAICPDLTENGLYEVIEFSDACGLKNYNEIADIVNETKKKINQIQEGPYSGYRIYLCRHISDDNSLDLAIERMFLIQVKENIGKPFLADLDNLLFTEEEDKTKRKMHQTEFKNILYPMIQSKLRDKDIPDNLIYSTVNSLLGVYFVKLYDLLENETATELRSKILDIAKARFDEVYTFYQNLKNKKKE